MPNGSGTKRGFDPRKEVLLQPLSIDTLRVFVNPPEVCIGEGSTKLLTVQWINNTSEVAWLWMPNGDQYFKKPSEHDFSTPFRIKPEPVPKEDRLTFAVKDEPKKVRSQYQVYCEAIKGYAEGNSPPVVDCP